METMKTRRVYDGRVINLRVDTLATANGPHEYEIVEHSGAVVVAVLPTPDTMVLVQQYRAPLGVYTWECCAGGIDKDESPETAALRELREETGFRARSIERLWSGYSAPGFCNELLHFFVVREFDPGETDFDEGEQIEIKTFKLDELATMMRNDQLRDCKTQIAVLWALNARIAS
jgi:ADP-ribose pyrophosphatase